MMESFGCSSHWKQIWVFSQPMKSCMIGSLPAPRLSCCPSIEHQQVTYSSSNAGHCLLRDFVLTLSSAWNALQPYFFMADPFSSFSSNFNFFWKFFSNHTCAHPFLSHYGVVFGMDHNLSLFVYLLSVIAIATAVWNLQG